jgi:hypothetical protein
MAAPISEPEAKGKKKNRWVVIAAVILAVIIIVALVGIFVFGNRANYNNFTSFNEHLAIRDNSNNITTTQLITLSDYTGEWTKVGNSFYIDIPYHSTGTGTLQISSIVCNTTGFSLTTVSPSLPVILPNTATIEEGSITLHMTFSAPETKYNGPFDFTVFYDYNN